MSTTQIEITDHEYAAAVRMAADNMIAQHEQMLAHTRAQLAALAEAES